jgi:hypothetical protein
MRHLRGCSTHDHHEPLATSCCAGHVSPHPTCCAARQGYSGEMDFDAEIANMGRSSTPKKQLGTRFKDGGALSLLQ